MAGHRTSVALEPEFWAALTRIAGQRGHTLSALVASADAKREPAQPLASCLRVLALSAFDPDARVANETEGPSGESYAPRDGEE